MPTGMHEQRAKLLAQQIEQEDSRVKARLERCDSQYYQGRTWRVVAILQRRNLMHYCYHPKQWAGIKVAWDELSCEEVQV